MTHSLKYFSLRIRLALSAAVLAGFSLSAFADTVEISPTPVDVTAAVAPNIVMTFDDSGSMDSDFMGDQRPYDSGSWSGPWRCAGVIDPTAAAGTAGAEPMNGVYYNPKITYNPPIDKDGNPFLAGDSSLAAVYNDGVDAERPNNPDTSDGLTNFLGARVVKVCIAYDRRGNCTAYNVPATTDARWSCPADSKSPLTSDSGGPYYYQYTGPTFKTGTTVDTATLYTKTNWTAVPVPVAQYQNWANWYAFYRKRNMMARTSVSIAFSDFSDNIRVAFQNINNGTYNLTATSGAPKGNTITELVGQQREDFYNWLFKIAPSGTTPNRKSVIRAGEFFAKNVSAVADATNPYWNGKTGDQFKALSCRRNFNMLVTDGYWNETNPALPTGFDGSLVHSTSLVLPDGQAYNASKAETQVYSNVPVNTTGGCGGDGSTDCYPSLADIAFYYWAKDLQPSAKMPNRLAPYTKVRSGDSIKDYFNPANDPATWQHVTQFMISLGVSGKLDYPDDLPRLIAKTIAWPQAARNNPAAIDDTWHAAINSRGAFFNANDPQQLVDKLKEFLSSVLARSGTAVAGALNTGVLFDGTISYVTSYDTSSWLGTLAAKKVGADGVLGATIWEQRIPASADRQVLTASASGSGKGVPFTWDKISSTEQAQLNKTPTGTTDTNGSTRLTAIRNLPLGAMIYSQPVFTSYPASAFRDIYPAGSPEETARQADIKNSYERYAYTYRERAKSIYVGANDGMLHAFAAEDRASPSTVKGGDELWAYVPTSVYGSLSKLTGLDPGLVPTVDNSPVVSDAFFKKSGDSAAKWHTILLGTLRLGGRGIFALDVTDPDAKESTAASSVLWEFNNTSPGGANLGYTFGNPNIARTASGKWVVLVAGGYFPTGDTSAPAVRKQSSLFVIDLETGVLIKEFVTTSGVNSWGLAGPVVGDYDDDQIDDVAFAGDLVGNMWRFDLSTVKATGTESNSTGVVRIFRPVTEKIQPITSMPRLFPDPVTNAFLVVFGTGQYLSPNDVRKEDIQSFYGIREFGGTSSYYPVTVDKLTAQTLSGTSTRTLTTASVPAVGDSGGKFLGWYINLSTVAGERAVVTPGAIFNTVRAVLTTLIPSGGSADPCNPGRLGAVMVVDALSGGAPLFDRNGATGGSVPTSGAVGGQVVNPPIAGTVPMAVSDGGGKITLPGVIIDGDDESNAFSVSDSYWRRRSWRQILN